MVTYVKGDVSREYGVPNTERTGGNGSEYELYLHIIGMFSAASHNRRDDFVNMVGFDSIAELNKRFFGQTDYYIAPEKSIDGSADIVVIRNDRVLFIDHFAVDASPCILSKRGHNAGSAYAQQLGLYKAGRITKAEFDSKLSTMDFSSSQLLQNIRNSVLKKCKKIDSYERAFFEYAATIDGGKPSETDSKKKREHWLLIENITPNAILLDADLLRETLAEGGFSGAIYAVTKTPDSLPSDVNKVAFVRGCA